VNPGRHTRSCAVAAALFFATAASSQDDDASADDTDSLTCISMNLVRQATAIDDRTIVFRLRDGRMYLNTLEQECLGLQRNNRFSYNLRTGARIPRLCHTDTITVIEQAGTGFTCGLGRFEPVSAIRVEDLLPARTDPSTVSVREIEIGDAEGSTEQQGPEDDE
jgi:hypothetical protein